MVVRTALSRGLIRPSSERQRAKGLFVITFPAIYGAERHQVRVLHPHSSRSLFRAFSFSCTTIIERAHHLPIQSKFISRHLIRFWPSRVSLRIALDCSGDVLVEDSAYLAIVACSIFL